MLESIKAGKTVSIRVPNHKKVEDYPVGSIQPLVADATKSVIGSWRVMEHHTTPMGQFVSGVVVKTAKL